jgi:cytidine deaminase
MIAAGGRTIKNIVVIGPGDVECTPCGDCRQRISEFSDAKTRIHTFAADKHINTYTSDDLLPKSFGPENLGVAR